MHGNLNVVILSLAITKCIDTCLKFLYLDFVPVSCKQYTNIGKQCFAGYMPSDLYNLNSAYGSVDELKHCIEEMHNQDLLVYVL